MASGITHILLMKQLQNELPDSDLKMNLAAGIHFLQVGAVCPDLPYASIADGDFFFSNQSDLADNFHYVKTNDVPLRAFSEIKSRKKELTKRELRYMFSFFLGYTSHILADGIIHPFVRDKVGDYNQNQAAHRKLEMELDVLLYHHLTLRSGRPMELNYSNIHKQLLDFDEVAYPEVNKTLSLLSKMINEVYGEVYDVDTIKGWVNGLYKMFDVAEGRHPAIYKNIGFISDFLFSDYSDLRSKYEEILILKTPKDRSENFVKSPQVHFFDDILPHFYRRFIPLAQKAFNYVYFDGANVTEEDIKPIDLDTGRYMATHNDLNQVPVYWS